MLLHLLNRDLPSANGMTLFAVRPQLTPVNICVAILASLADIGEEGLDVALRATNGSVHATKRIPCLIVIEFGDGANRFPCARRVTVLTGDVQVPVRTVGRGRHLRAQISRDGGKCKQQDSNCLEYAPKPQHSRAPCLTPQTSE